MIGGGFLFALLPLLEGMGESDGEGGGDGEIAGLGGEAEMEEVVARHGGHFNSHPFLAGLALGAVARMEREGASPEHIERFKAAVRSPLGSLGDALFWTGWLPLVMFLAATLLLLELPPLAVIGGALLLYNIPHFLVRRVTLDWGLALGSQAPARLREAGVARLIERVRDVGMGVLGLLVGVLVSVGPASAGPPGMPWWVAALVLGMIVLRGGPATGKVANRLAPIVLILLFVLGGRL